MKAFKILYEMLPSCGRPLENELKVPFAKVYLSQKGGGSMPNDLR